MAQETKICEVCGKELPITKFSKSYKNRCRECVAERTRLCRHLSKEEREEREKNLLINEERRKIDWEIRRYDLTKAAMVAMIDKRGGNHAAIIAMDAVEIADEVIKELQKGGSR